MCNNNTFEHEARRTAFKGLTYYWELRKKAESEDVHVNLTEDNTLLLMFKEDGKGNVRFDTHCSFIQDYVASRGQFRVALH